MAYPSSTLSGDSGVSLRAAFSRPFLVSPGLIVAPYVFGSYGSAWAAEEVNGSYNYTDLLSCGVGIDISYAQKFSGKIEFAHPLGKGFEEGVLKDKVYKGHVVFTLGATF